MVIKYTTEIERNPALLDMKRYRICFRHLFWFRNPETYAIYAVNNSDDSEVLLGEYNSAEVARIIFHLLKE